jgi:hypothetical protein
MSSPGNYWGSDTPISMPEPPSDDVIIDMGAHGFTVNGFVHNINESDLEDYKIPTFGPSDSHG